MLLRHSMRAARSAVRRHDCIRHESDPRLLPEPLNPADGVPARCRGLLLNLNLSKAPTGEYWYLDSHQIRVREARSNDYCMRTTKHLRASLKKVAKARCALLPSFHLGGK